jgi:hypothetical protein
MLVTIAATHIAYVIPQTEVHLPSRLHAHRLCSNLLESENSRQGSLNQPNVGGLKQLNGGFDITNNGWSS